MSAIFIVVFTSVFTGLNILVAFFMVNWTSAISIVHFFVYVPINIGVAYGLSELIFSVALKKREPPKLDTLEKSSKVALLYVTCDDAMPEIISELKEQTYERCDLFILDDSSKDTYKNIVDKSGKGAQVLRRKSRQGFKAGNLNNWLARYGDEYEYFSVADSDSRLPCDFIENMLKYAEHPANKDIAIFQSKIRYWNTENRFVKTLSAMGPFWLFKAEKIGPRLKTLLSYGHNDLVRTKYIKEIGGYDEAFVSEDFATSLRLFEKGYEIRMVDVESSEAMPNTVQSYAKRQARYCKQSFQILRLLPLSVPLTTKLRLAMNAYSYAVWPIFSIGAFLSIWGYSSSFGGLLSLTKFIVTGSVLHSSFLAPLLIIIFYQFYFTLLRLPLALKLGISAKEYFNNLILTMAVGFYASVPVLKALLETMLGKDVEFEVTDKKCGEILSVYQIIYETRLIIITAYLLTIGLIKNPMALAFNFPWLLPLMFTPLIIHVFTPGLPLAHKGQKRALAKKSCN